MVDQGKAKSIEMLKGKVVNEMESKNDSINFKDSIIFELKDSINLLKKNNK